jgi:S1-C subfamily serine protease
MSSNEAQPSQNANGPVPATSVWLVAILLVLVGILIARLIEQFSWRLFDPNAAPRVVAARGDLAADEKATVELFRAASPSVVHITTTVRVRENPLSFNVLEIPQGTGSGFIWDEKGYVVTNYHVIQGAYKARVTLADNSVHEAEVVGGAPDKDLAVLKINAPRGRLKPIPVGSSADLQVGQKVFAIGSPFELDQTLTTGVISGVGREILSTTRRPIQGVIQTDAAINPGNSGGPLLDSAGRLIGINTAIYSPSGAFAGIGFAVPVDTVNVIVPELIRHGTVERPGLGVTLATETIATQLAERGEFSKSGVLVLDVLKGSAAEEAGIRPTRHDADGKIIFGDWIVELDGRRVENANSLFKILEGKKVGDKVTVKVVRDGDELSLPLTLQVLPGVEP